MEPTPRWRIHDVRRVLLERQAGLVDDSVVDTTSAQTIVTVFEAMNAANQARAQQMPLSKFAAFAWGHVQWR